MDHIKAAHGKYHEKFRGEGLGEARLVLMEDGDLYLDAAFSRTVTLPEMSANAKVIAVDVDENFIVHGNDDFVKSF